MNSEQTILQKYAGIDFDGRNTAKQGQLETFRGFPPSLANRMNVSLLFDEESQELVKREVMKPLDNIDHDTGINILLAGADYPIHTTVLEGEYEGNDTNERQAIFHNLQHSGSVDYASRNLTDLSLEFNHLLIDKKGGIILTAVCIPQEITDTRDRLTSLYQEHDLKVLPQHNILHITVGRVIGLPLDREESQNAQVRLEDSIVKLRRYEISPHPLTLQVASIYKGSALNLISKQT